jgi:hypothetical protein
VREKCEHTIIGNAAGYWLCDAEGHTVTVQITVQNKSPRITALSRQPSSYPLSLDWAFNIRSSTVNIHSFHFFLLLLAFSCAFSSFQFSQPTHPNHLSLPSPRDLSCQNGFPQCPEKALGASPPRDYRNVQVNAGNQQKAQSTIESPFIAPFFATLTLSL